MSETQNEFRKNEQKATKRIKMKVDDVIMQRMPQKNIRMLIVV
jgi:hypothetical protein